MDVELEQKKALQRFLLLRIEGVRKMEGGLPLRILYEKLEKQLESSRNENRLLKEEIEEMELAYNTLEDRYYKLKEVLERLPVDIEDMIE